MCRPARYSDVSLEKEEGSLESISAIGLSDEQCTDYKVIGWLRGVVMPTANSNDYTSSDHAIVSSTELSKQTLK